MNRPPVVGLFVSLFGAVSSIAWSADGPIRAENIVVVTLDGFRWQEIFEGADAGFMTSKAGGVRDEAGLKQRYLRASVDERRRALLPFFWETIAKQGQLFGNPAKQASARLTNGLTFSYPGYSEMFCGVVDPRIDSNAKKENPNLSVLEFLNGRPRFKDRVEVVGTWDVFPSILRTSRNGLRIQAGWEPIQASQLTAREQATNELMGRLPKYWPDNVYDAFAMEGVRSAFERRKPKVLYIALGETDEWGHGRRYDLYLDAAHKADRFLAETWGWMQRDPDYRNKTALLVTTDHGRGGTRVDWTDHGKDVPGAERIWIGVMGPGVAPRGERDAIEAKQCQIAATIAAVVGEDFRRASPNAAAPLEVWENR